MVMFTVATMEPWVSDTLMLLTKWDDVESPSVIALEIAASMVPWWVPSCSKSCA